MDRNNMKKSGFLIAGLAVTAISQANFNVNSVSGELLIDGSAYGGGNLEAGQNIRLNSMAGNSMSSLGFSPVNTNQGNYGGCSRPRLEAVEELGIFLLTAMAECLRQRQEIPAFSILGTRTTGPILTRST